MYDRLFYLHPQDALGVSFLSRTCIMSHYDQLKVYKLMNQSMHDYLIYIKSTRDCLANCGHPIEEMKQISIILNGVKGQYDNVVFVIHMSHNPYDIASNSFVLLGVEAWQSNLLFDPTLCAVNVMVKHVFLPH